MSHLKRDAALRIIAISIINPGILLLTAYLVTVAAGCTVDIIAFAALFPLITLATMLPISFGGLGVRELMYVEALSLIGVPTEQGLVISLATSALLMSCNLCGILFLPSVPKDLRSKQEG